MGIEPMTSIDSAHEDVEVIFFFDEHNKKVGSIAVKGLGEIGIAGTAVTGANPIYHAT